MGCGSADQCVTETITHTNAPDGIYHIVMTYDENCPGTGIWPTCDFGLGLEEADCNVNIYINDESTPTYQLTNLHFEETGAVSELSWRIVRNNASGTNRPQEIKLKGKLMAAGTGKTGRLAGFAALLFLSLQFLGSNSVRMCFRFL
jgi:hypothetical protein